MGLTTSSRPRYRLLSGSTCAGAEIRVASFDVRVRPWPALLFGGFSHHGPFAARCVRTNYATPARDALVQ